MRAKILDPQVKVYSSMDTNALSIATLPVGSEIELGSTIRKAGKLWVPVILSTGQKAYILGETRVYVIQQGTLLQDNIILYSEPDNGSMVKLHLPRGSKLMILQVIKSAPKRWVQVRDMNGVEGYIDGETRIRVTPQRTKAIGMRNLRSGALWVVAGLIILLSNKAPQPGSVYIMFGYAMLFFGGVMLVAGLLQYLRAPA